MRKDVDAAWHQKDFKRVLELYAPLKAYLTPAEIKKLEYARKRVH
jgi:hypothetical protein